MDKKITTHKIKMILFAKELYFTMDEANPTVHKFSFQEIAHLVNEKFDKNITKQAVHKWKKEYGWDLELKQWQVSIVKKDKQKVYENKFEKNLDGFLEVTEKLEIKLMDMLDDEDIQIHPKIIFETYARLITSHTDVLKTKQEIELKRLELEEQKSQVNGFEALQEKIIEDVSGRIIEDIIQKEKIELEDDLIEDADYEVMSKEEDE